ncbi:MAG: substrate-binding domain-containing protein [Burkholderiales bacterium]|nr:substrate-binding domain-containing protein [Phycisphaerae bacterium]
MKRILLLSITTLLPTLLPILLLSAGCAPTSVRTAGPATQPTLKPNDGQVSAAKTPEYRVVEIITKPVLIKRGPATRPTQSGGGVVTTRAGNTDTAVSGSAIPDAPIPRFTLDGLKRVDTSLSTAPLLRLVTMKLNGIPYQRFAGYGAVDFTPELPEGVNPDAMTSDILAREPSGSATAIERLAKGEVDLILLSRQPTADELAAAKKNGAVLRSDLIATEALIFTVNTANPTTNLSLAQLKTIFSGKAQKWADVQIPELPATTELAGKPLTVAYRAKGLGTEELMSQLLLDGQPVPELPVSRALATEKLVLDATNEDNETIGFSVFCYTTNMERDNRSKVLAVEGVRPEPATVADGRYPLTAPIFVVTRADLDTKNDLYGLRRWLLAMNGQRVLAEAGYLPQIQEAWTQQRLMEKPK